MDTASWQRRRWARYIDPGERVPPLSTRNKLQYWLHDEVRPTSAVPEFISAFYGQPLNVPAYGTDAGGFGERLGAAFIRDATMRFFVSSLLPAIAHEDPRYLRKASGTWQSRARWATTQTIIDRHDSGRRGFNFSDVVGHLAASILILAYYPDPSANTGMVFRTWGTSLAGTAGNNLFLEFWPDVVHKVIHRRRWLRHKAHLEAGLCVSEVCKQSR